MDAKELLAYSIDNVGFQLEKVFVGLPASVQSSRACPSGMCPPEMIEHLCEAYQAVLINASGGTYEWGTFVIIDKSWDNLVATFKLMRQQARNAVIGGDEKLLKAGVDYIVLHDAYHVGQMASILIDSDLGWDPYSIYQH